MPPGRVLLPPTEAAVFARIGRVREGMAEARWYQNAIIYEVQVALFRDSLGNGWGNLRGLIEKLEYIQDLGAEIIWLQPLYRGPFVDGGYDVTDHLGVNDRLGTLDDFDDLVREADRLGLRIVLDLVMQHTSSQHPWFRAACRDPDSKYRGYYVWAEKPAESEIDPAFPGVEDHLWTFQEQAGLYYRHTFYSHEPDLDLSNPDVIEELDQTMEFWLDRGIAGFRVDAVPYMVYQAGQRPGVEDGSWLLEHLREVVRRKRPDGVLIAESDLDPEQYAGQFGEGDRMTHVLDFWMNNNLWLALARGSAEPLVRALETQPTPPEGCLYANWLRNHDELDLERLTPDEREETLAVFAPHPQMRAYGRGIRRRLAPMLIDPRQRKLAFFLLCALPGVPVLLYGDEIGMGENLDLPERAAVRTPMQWTAGRNAGFSEAPPSTLVAPVVDDGYFRYGDVNVEAQLAEQGSHLRTVQQMFATRRRLGPLLTREMQVLDVGEDAVLALRYDTPDGISLCLANLSGRAVDVSLPVQGDGWNEEAADLPAEGPVDVGRVRLNGFGFRWLHAVRPGRSPRAGRTGSD